MLLWLLLGCFSRALGSSRLVVECDVVEHKAGFNGGVDDITALRAMKKGKMILYASTLVYKVLFYRYCGKHTQNLQFQNTFKGATCKIWPYFLFKKAL